MSAWQDDDPGDLAADLRADAASWRMSPSAGARRRLQANLDRLPARRVPAGRAGLVAAVTAASLLALVALALRDRSATDRTAAPMHRELVDLARDVHALADAFWRRLPAPLRRLRTN